MVPLVLVSICLLGLAAPEPREDPFTPRQFADLVERQRARANPFLVTFRIEHQVDEALLAAEKDTLRPVWSETTVAFDGPKQYCKTHSLAVRGENREEVLRTAVFTGTRSLVRQRKRLQIQAEKSAYSALNSYTNILMWPVTDNELQNARESGARSAFLPAMLRDGDWVVDEGFENEGGVPCRVLATRDGSRRLWLDPRRNYAILRCLEIRPYATASRIDTQYQDHLKVADGLFLPRRIVSQWTVIDPQEREIGHRTNVLTVSELKVGPLPAGLFDLPPKVGETVIDVVNNQVYQYYPEDDRSFERSITAARGQLALVSPSRSRSLWLPLVGSVVTLAGGFGLARLLGRWIRSSQSGVS